MGPPTILPAVTLPNFGCNTAIKTAPPTLKSMFDFGISGPLTGVIISIILLGAGVQMTTATTDAAIYSYFPSLSVDALKISRLGGSIIDAALNGALTSTLNTDVSSIQLHPFALAGYIGLIINALNLLPLGSESKKLPVHLCISFFKLTFADLPTAKFCFEQKKVLMAEECLKPYLVAMVIQLFRVWYT